MKIEKKILKFIWSQKSQNNQSDSEQNKTNNKAGSMTI
jgi:hypothetical protein